MYLRVEWLMSVAESVAAMCGTPTLLEGEDLEESG